jgi:hypothetical protein
MEQLVTATGTHASHAHVAAIVDAKATSLADAPIQHYVGVLVEHDVRDQLSAEGFHLRST